MDKHHYMQAICRYQDETCIWSTFSPLRICKCINETLQKDDVEAKYLYEQRKYWKQKKQKQEENCLILSVYSVAQNLKLIENLKYKISFWTLLKLYLGIGFPSLL